MWLFLCLVVAASGSLANHLTDEEVSQFPKLFHLDDYDRCLASPGGLYCLGSFRLAPLLPDQRVYHALEEYSKDPLNFNRTFLHRGYCVSSRCPGFDQDVPLNQSQQFADCVAQWGRTQGFKTTLLSVDYCTTSEHQKHAKVQLDVPKIIFVVVVACILFFNIIGTVYDALTPNDVKKNKYLLCWSCACNWQRLSAPSGHKEPGIEALLPAHGVRVIILLVVMLLHCGMIHFVLYSHNPQTFEKMMHSPAFILFRNGTPGVCIFIVLSSFLLANGLLQLARTQPLSYRLLPTTILHRVARISPLYLLVVGFSATWWPELSDGPLWHTVRAEAARCRGKFWAHALYVGNLVRPDDQCLIQTWFLAVEMQLYIVSCVLTVFMSRLGAGAGRALLLLAALFGATCLLNGALAYGFQWRSMLFIMNPENLRSLFAGVASFHWLYAAPWGALPAAALGVLLAHLHRHLLDIKFKFTDYKVLTWVYRYSVHLKIALMASGWWVAQLSGAAAVAAHAALDRPLAALAGALLLLGLFQGVDGLGRRVFSWRPLVAASRVSLAALLLHWGVALTALAPARAPLPAGYMAIFWEWLATAATTYILSVPLTLLVELPAQRTIRALFT